VRWFDSGRGHLSLRVARDARPRISSTADARVDRVYDAWRLRRGNCAPRASCWCGEEVQWSRSVIDATTAPFAHPESDG
jgi:hypothetical protein